MSSDSPVFLTESSVEVIQETVSTVKRLNPFGTKQELGNAIPLDRTFVRGYLMQPVSRGQSALCSLVTRGHGYYSYKIDFAGVFTEHRRDWGRFGFRLEFLSKNKVLFLTRALPVFNLPIGTLLYAISEDSNGLFPIQALIGDLGNPVVSNMLVENDESYPTLEYRRAYKLPQMAYTGSWIFAIPKQMAPPELDINLNFSLSNNDRLQLPGPGMMAIYQISDIPAFKYIHVHDIMDVRPPSPLRGGSLIVAAPFEDIGYGIIAATPRDHFFIKD